MKKDTKSVQKRYETKVGFFEYLKHDIDQFNEEIPPLGKILSFLRLVFIPTYFLLRTFYLFISEINTSFFSEVLLSLEFFNLHYTLNLILMGFALILTFALYCFLVKTMYLFEQQWIFKYFWILTIFGSLFIIGFDGRQIYSNFNHLFIVGFWGIVAYVGSVYFMYCAIYS